MKLFTIGPVEMFEHTLALRSKGVPYFRTDEFSAMMLETDRLLKIAVGTSLDSKVVYLTASGTAAMEAAVINCLGAQDRALIINGGTFGQRFVDICARHHIPHDHIDLEFGVAFEPSILSAYENKGYSVLLVNLHETSTGQLYDVHCLSDFCSRNGMLFVVDAISTFFCDEYEMDKHGIDVTILSSHKGLCLSPGLSMIVMSPRAVARVCKHGPSENLYFDFANYYVDMERGQTPFTPAVGVLCELNDMLKVVLSKGILSHLGDVRSKCNLFRSVITGQGCLLPTYPLSAAITPVVFKRDIAYDVFTFLKEEYGWYTNPTGGVYGRRVLRIAHVGANSTEDYRVLAQRITDCVKRLAG